METINGKRERTPSDWLERAASSGTMLNHKLVLKHWTQANGFSSPEEGVERIRNGYDIYESADLMVKRLIERKLAPQTIKLHRGLLPVFFEFLSPKLGFDREEYERAVRKTKAYKITEDRIPTWDEARKVLISAPTPKCKGFVAVLICTGRRLNEVATLRVRDVDFASKPVRVYFRASKVKTGVEAMAFLSAESAEIVQTYLRNRGFENQWLFPGAMDNKPFDKPLSKVNAWKLTMNGFEAAGVASKTEIGRNVYHPHSWRSYAMAHMRASGLNELWVKQITGHNTGVEEHYKDWDTIAKSWFEKCEPEFTFITPTIAMEKMKAETEKTQKAVEELRLAAERRLRSLETTTRFSNHEYDYVKTTMASGDFDRSLSEGYEMVTLTPDPSGFYLLRKGRKNENVD